MNERSTAAFIAVGLVALAAAVGLYLLSILLPPPSLPWQEVHAELDMKATVVGTVARVQGTTNLPDGALIDYVFWSEAAPNEGPAGAAEVQDGAFAFDEDLSSSPRGPWSIYVSFSTAWGSEQPANVLALVGTQGEHLSGPQVYVDSPGDPKQLFVSLTVDLH